MDRLRNTIYETFEIAAKKYAEKSALIFLGKVFSYRGLKEAVETTSSGLLRLGVEKGEKVVIYMPNSPQWIIAWLALERIGAVAVPITPFYTVYDLKYIANDSGAETIFCMDTNFGYVSQALSQTNLKRTIVTNIAELLPPWKRFIGRAFDRIPEGKFSKSDNTISFSRLMKMGKEVLPSAKPEVEDISLLLYTGGTTGFPKGVPISGSNLVQKISIQRQPSEHLIPKGEDVVIQGAPLYHIFGHVQGLGALFHGDTLVVLPRFNLDGLLYHIDKYEAKTLFGVPALFRMILEHDRLESYSLHSLMYCLSAGDSLPLEVASKWGKKIGKTLYQGYGTTETCGAGALTPVTEDFPSGTIGQNVPLQKIRIVDPDTLESVDNGEPGELLVCSVKMVKRYWNKPEETEKCFVEHDGELWYRTGDIVRSDSKGWLFFEDRTADIIKHKGYRVAASRIETILQEHPTVVASCVVGVPDKKVGERIKAFVVLKEDVRGVGSFELLKWCRDRLSPYEVPQYIEFRDMLPKSKVGKLLRRDVRSQERRKLEES